MPKKTYYRTSLILLILSTIIMVLTWLSDLSQTNKLIIIVIVGIILSWYVQYFSKHLTDGKQRKERKNEVIKNYVAVSGGGNFSCCNRVFSFKWRTTGY
ncbi:hypothetical protein V6R94_02835 [Pediococcus acidilactici]